MRSSPTSSDEHREGERRRSWGPIAAIALLLLLLLCCGCLLWPVPSAQESGRASVGGRAAKASSLSVEVIEVSAAQVNVGSKGYAAVVGLRIVSKDAQRRLDLNHFALEIDNVSLPPVPVTEDAGKLHVIPAVAPAGRPVEAAVVFAVPYGARDAKLVVNMPDVAAGSAVRLDVQLPAEEIR